MSSRIRVVPTLRVATMVAFALALCTWGMFAAAQVTIQPKAEVYAGYSWIHPGGHYDFGQPTQDHAEGIDESITFYLPVAHHNLGFLVDSSQHFGIEDQSIYYVLGGIQYKYHTDKISPFVRLLGGEVRQVAPTYIDQWNAVVGGGGGLDYTINEHIGIRVAQVDYLYSNYRQFAPVAGIGPHWNSIRLSAGLVFSLGNYYTPTPTAACTAQPTEVTEGEPVTVTATGTNFNPKHTVNYAWTTTGGKLAATDKQSAQIDTTGTCIAPACTSNNYTANATLTDPKQKRGGTASCSAAFTVKAKPLHPPEVSCTANPATVQSGSPSTITATATSPDNAQISSVAFTATGGTINGTGTTATLDTAGLAAGPVTVTATATDARTLTGSGSCTVNVEVPPPPPSCSKINSIQFPDKKRPWRVDNTAKAILDDVASRLKADPNAKIAIVGYADGEKAPMEGTGKKRHKMDLAAQRAVNAKAYLVQQQGIDPSRIEVRSGTGQSQVANIVWIPQGADVNNAQTCADLQNTTPVDESLVMPSQNAYPKARAMAAPAHHKRGKMKKGAMAPAEPGTPTEPAAPAAPAEQPATPPPAEQPATPPPAEQPATPPQQ